MLLSLVLLVLAPAVVTAQKWTQDWQIGANNVKEWRPGSTGAFTPVIEPSSEVILEYNCYYMRSICENARQWFASKGQRSLFAYDFDGNRKEDRRTESCPYLTWKNNHACPETGNPPQEDIYRWDKRTNTGKIWGTKALKNPGRRSAAGVPDYTIDDEVDPVTNVRTPSLMTWSCDEFPPATFIQGGSGSNTRCAAIRCGVGVSAEQNWQGDSHKAMREIMQILIDQDRNNQAAGPNEVVLFTFRASPGSANGIPVKIYQRDRAGVEQIQSVPFRKREDDIMPEEELSLEELVAAGRARVHNILMNSNNTGMEHRTGLVFESDIFGKWQDEFESFDTGASTTKSVSARGAPASNAVKNITQSSATATKLPSLASIHGLGNDATPWLKNSTETDLERAVRIVEDAITASTKHNQARYQHVARNVYELAPGTIIGSASGIRRRRNRGVLARLMGRDEVSSQPPPLLDITPDMAAAAALVAEADAAGITGHQAPAKKTLTSRATTGSFWMGSISRKGTVPWGSDSTYKVFRNVVTDYGAKGDGTTDDTAAIQKAMIDGNRCGENCNGSTLKNAIVYFPPGNYLVSKTIEMPFGTQVIGDANSRPTIVATSRFIGLGVLSTDKYTGGGLGADGLDQEYYINTANFYRQIRNIIVDITATRPTQGVSGIHYQVAQATSMQNVDLIAKSGTDQRGMFAENGSGGQISDVNFKGGNFCFYGGNQQFTAQRLNFDGCATAVRTIWDWGWVWKTITVKNTNIGFQLLAETGQKASNGKSSVGSIGSASFIDSTFSSVGTAVVVGPINSAPGSGSTGIVLENVDFSSVTKGVADSTGKTLLDGGTKHIDEWAAGPIYSPNRTFSMGANALKYKRVTSLVDTTKKNQPYYERARPQYETRAANDFIHTKDLGAKGDGKTDDTAALQSIFRNNVGKIIFVDAGTYILTDTVTVPAGSIIVGETWSQLAASGSKFSDAKNPRAMLRVGNPGDVGTIEMQDLLFTTQGPTAGAILVQWNIKASFQGGAAMWDCHARVGGATGTGLTSAKCPAITSGTNSGCQGASLMMHVTSQASGYFENVWLWGADHDIDDPNLSDPNNDMKQCSVYVARGFLIESQSATWLYGTASEHSVFYQYNFNKARNLFVGMMQTESPYYQPMPKPPAPFTDVSGRMSGDPSYRCGSSEWDGCDASWAVIIRGSQNIFVAGAGLYSWFSTYTQDCIDSQSCQKALMLIEKNQNNIRLQHLITIGAKYMIVQDGKAILATDNLNVNGHPRWSQISIFDLTGNLTSYVSPDSATIIPLPHTTVPPKSTFTLSQPIVPDVKTLPYDGNQNSPTGPGRNSCTSCDFFRLITSTCCGTDGSVGNPIVIPSGVPLPVPITLPEGFNPNQNITGSDGRTYPGGKGLPNPVTIPAGTSFSQPFLIPAGQPLGEGGQDNDTGGGIIWIDPVMWNSTNPTVYCDNLPCTFLFPPWTSATTTIPYPPVTITTGSITTTVTRSAITVSEWVFSPVTVTQAGPTTVPTGAKSSTDGPIFFIWPPPSLASTSTWPPIWWGPDSSHGSTYRPKTPHPPPPATTTGPGPGPGGIGGKWPSVTITVKPGKPGPSVRPCGFPAFGCPNKGNDPDGPGNTFHPPGDPEGNNDDDDDDDDEDSDSEDPSPCFNENDDGGTNPGGGGTTPPDTSGHPTGKAYTGSMTYYNGGRGSCGVGFNELQPIVALSKQLMNAGGSSNPSQSPLCGKKLKITRGNQYLNVTVQDTCGVCPNIGDMDATKSVFQFFGGNLDQGRINDVNWQFYE